MKICSSCQVEKSFDAFKKNASRKDGYARECKECVKQYRKEFFKTPKGKQAQRRNAIQQRYGIPGTEYEVMFEKQGGVCRICREAPEEGKVLHIDHCHNSLAVRGLLCNQCNLGLGHFKDSPDRLRAALDYLAKTG